MDGGGVNLDEQQISHQRDDLLANDHSIQSTTAVIDWISRRVLAWRLSITLEVEFCIEAITEALARHGKRDIFNID